VSRNTDEQIDAIIDLALAEDTGSGDVTSEALIPGQLQGRATIMAKESGIVAGGGVAEKVFLRVDPSLKTEIVTGDGGAVKPGDIIATVSGSVISILKAERTALNFMQHLSGIATETARYVAAIKGLKTKILDTRKTAPGMRALEKAAVRMGGGHNHRYNLGDGILIKDNHLAALRARGMTITDIVAQARRNAPKGMKIEVETGNIEEALEAAEAGADIVMLDNMAPDEMRLAVEALPAAVKTEASGGITLANVRAAAGAGVDYISIGALTHSVKALDISLELDPQRLKLI